MSTPTSNGKVAGLGCRRLAIAATAPPPRGSAPGIARRDALLPRRPHPSRDRVRLGVSRPTAGRLVARAKARGLVRIDVVIRPTCATTCMPTRSANSSSGSASRKPSSRATASTSAPGRPAAYASVGRAAAALLMRRLSPNDVLGFTWGPEQVAVADALSPGIASCRAVVQLDGAMSTAAYQTGTEFILSRCADVLRANTIRLPAPLYADPSTVASMRSDSLISRTLEAGRRADVMLFGVGAVSTSTTLVRRQLPGHADARRADLVGCGWRDRRPVLRRRRHAGRHRTAAAGGLSCRSKTSGPVRRPS